MIEVIDSLIAILRPALLGLAAGLGVVATLDWMVRTRRVSPFGLIARVMRRNVDPLLMPIERRVVRAGGLPAHAPFWALMVVIVTGIIVVAGLGFLRDQLAFVLGSLDSGPRGVYRLVVSWTFTLMQIAIVVRVLLSWVHGRPGAWYARWSYRLSEPILRPIRNVIPLIRTIDISPIVAWFLLGIIQSVLLGLW
ncbi:MAG: YggT family protein [Gemmatimonadetes bacterium]|nr:YggT family protein [Gemmatimonadota bacterium]